MNVIKCPSCGDTWVCDDNYVNNKNIECKCFRCGHNYKPPKIYNMFDFVFQALKRTKG